MIGCLSRKRAEAKPVGGFIQTKKTTWITKPYGKPFKTAFVPPQDRQPEGVPENAGPNCGQDPRRSHKLFSLDNRASLTHPAHR
jgi:hypothetical protein